jgi:hypothetical protein
MQRRVQILSLLLCLGFGLAIAPYAEPAHAATLIALDLPELVRTSDYVVVANALNESSRYADKLIVTDVELRVITSMKGSAKPGETLVATHLGGAVDRIGLRVPGAASFKIGQSAIVFLRRAPGGGDLNVTGMSQGVMPILGNAVQTGGVAPGTTLMQRDAKGVLVEAPAKAAESKPLSDLITQIEELAKQ